jgi:amino acid adenylation domain-containing protein
MGRSIFPRAEYPRDATVHSLFSQQANRTPESPALLLPSERGDGQARVMSYGVLDRRSDELAAALRAEGVRPGDLVVVFMERSLELGVALVGTLKTGAAYVPLDPGYPAERLRVMLSLCGEGRDDHPGARRQVILTQSGISDRLPEADRHHLIRLDEGWRRADADVQPAHQGAATDLAYVMFTSGSTGEPKGVAVPHRGITRLVLNTSYTPLDASRILLQLAPISFDASTLEIWGALLHGARCVLFPGGSVPDPDLLEGVIRNQGVTTLWLTASLFNTIVSEQPSALSTVAEILTGGEALSVPHVRRALEALPRSQLVNGYGPTESTTFTTCYRIPRPLPEGVTSISIGQPISNTEVCILDGELRAVPPGEPGELCIGGDGLAVGYLNRPKLTDERFVAHPFSDQPDARLYRTGDRVRLLPDGNIEFLGRMDDQVKIRGYRIELSEIQTALKTHPSVRDGVVVVQEASSLLGVSKRLVGYYVLEPAATATAEDLRSYLAERLAQYMVPTDFIKLERIPVTPNGKVDKNALPAPAVAEIDEVDYRAPATPTEVQVARVWAEVLGRSRVGVESNFFDIGGTSILAIQLVARLHSQTSLKLPLVRFYQNPTVRALSRFLDAGSAGTAASARKVSRDRTRDRNDHVAIIGMAGRFPGADSVDELWTNLLQGRATTRFFEKDELDPSLDPAETEHPDYVRARGIVQDAECFDHAFFGISKREAEVTDPQQRVFMEVAHAALEDAGCDPDRYEGAIGLYAGSGNTTYFNDLLSKRDDAIQRAGAFLTRLGNEKDFLTTRVSYKLNLRGPSVPVNTACSTSLVAVVMAVEALLTGLCDVALAGGVTIHTPQASGYLYQEGSMLSPDGVCRPFDADAQGTMFNSGVGVVVLKRLEDALAEGDRIDAVILGAAVNNDGSGRMSFSAPSVEGQAEVVARALARASVEPESISYVETHGTATPVGDPIEVQALAQAFGPRAHDEPHCGLGSVKSNLGHIVSAAGVTGLIKAALSLKERRIPATLHFKRPNPELYLETTPFFVVDRLTSWDHGARPRRAGVSSFGVGGTNAHVVLQEPPEPVEPGSSRPWQLLALSARTPEALERSCQNLADHLARHPDSNLPNVAFTLNVGRRQFNYRRVLVASTAEQAVEALRTGSGTRSRHTEDRDRPVAFLFPGQGSQYVRMGTALRDVEPVFTDELNRCADLLRPHLGADLRDLIYPGPGDEEAAARSLCQTRITQPALFAIEYSLAKLWMSFGVKPEVMIGHSIGELVCACLAGVFSLEEATELVALRGRYVQQVAEGGMLSVRKAADQLTQLLPEDLDLAAINAPELCVVAGPNPRIDQFAEQLQKEGIACKRLYTSHGFHSKMMDPVILPFAREVKRMRLRPPSIPFISTVTGQLITDAEATDPMYWGQHLRRTVRYSEGAHALLSDPRRILLEVGPRSTLITLARQQANAGSDRVTACSLGDRPDPEAEWRSLLGGLGQLWLAGVSPDWNGFYAYQRRSRVALPTYPFEKTRCWVDLPPWQPPVSAGATTGTRPRHDIAELGQRPGGAALELSSDAIAGAASAEIESVFAAQLQLMGQQLTLLQGVGAAGETHAALAGGSEGSGDR